VQHQGLRDEGAGGNGTRDLPAETSALSSTPDKWNGFIVMMVLDVGLG
jgi:hypothetical protein